MDKADVRKKILEKLGYRLPPNRPELREIEEILKIVWYSGKNDSQVFDFPECVNREGWIGKVLALFEGES